MGPGLLGVSHTPNEYVEADDVEAAAKAYALFALRYLAQPSEDRPGGERA
jgi:acetylornithine deacetylase/succinyl-diaminopimelate desuccinylase-like protein